MKNYLDRLQKPETETIKRTFDIPKEDYLKAKKSLKDRGIKMKEAIALFFKDLANEKKKVG